MNPVGPEQPSTYWRRRAAVFVVLLVLLWGSWLVLRTAFGIGGDPQAGTPAPSPSFGLSMTAQPGASAEPSDPASPAPAAGPQASAASSVSPSPSPSTLAACTDAVIEVSAGTAGSSTSVGAGMALTMTVTNTAGSACTRDVGAGANELRITSGSVLVWSSNFCDASAAEDRGELAPDKAFTTSTTWPGRVTAKGCPADQPVALPGSYLLVARNGAVESEPVPFTVK